MRFGGYNKPTASSSARDNNNKKENQQPSSSSSAARSSSATRTNSTKRTSSANSKTTTNNINKNSPVDNLPPQQKDPSQTPPERSAPQIKPTSSASAPNQQQQSSKSSVEQQQQKQFYLQQLQQQHARNAKVISRLQTELGEWKQQRDTAQIIFMQENSALERLQKSLDQARLRVERKKQMLQQYSVYHHQHHQKQPTTSISSIANENDQTTNGESQQQQHIQNHVSISSRVSTVGTQVLPPQKRDVALQCDTALIRAFDFVKSVEISHRENLLSLQQLKKSVVDSANQRNVELAEEVADLVRRTQVIQRELLDQLERFHKEKMSQDQTAVAERLVKSVIIIDGGSESATSDEDAMRRYLLSDVSMIGNNNNNSNFMMMNESTFSSSHHQDPTVNARFLARDPSEAVYRTVERARLALSQALVKY